MKMKHSKPSVYKFVTNKLKLRDSEISDVTQYLLQQSKKHCQSVDTNQISFLTDLCCNIYLNQFDLQLSTSAN